MGGSSTDFVLHSFHGLGVGANRNGGKVGGGRHDNGLALLPAGCHPLFGGKREGNGWVDIRVMDGMGWWTDGADWTFSQGLRQGYQHSRLEVKGFRRKCPV